MVFISCAMAPPSVVWPHLLMTNPCVHPCRPPRSEQRLLLHLGNTVSPESLLFTRVPTLTVHKTHGLPRALSLSPPCARGTATVNVHCHMHCHMHAPRKENLDHRLQTPTQTIKTTWAETNSGNLSAGSGSAVQNRHGSLGSLLHAADHSSCTPQMIIADFHCVYTVVIVLIFYFVYLFWIQPQEFSSSFIISSGKNFYKNPWYTSAIQNNPKK